MMEILFLIGFLTMLVGILITMLAILLEVVVKKRESEEKSSVQGGAVIMIGPIPIVLSTDPNSAKLLMILAIVLMAIFFLFLFLLKAW